MQISGTKYALLKDMFPNLIGRNMTTNNLNNYDVHNEIRLIIKLRLRLV